MNRAFQMQAVSHTSLALNSFNIATITDIFESQKILRQEYLKGFRACLSSSAPHRGHLGEARHG